MAWRRIGGKPLSEPMLTRFADACMWYFYKGGGGELTRIYKPGIRSANNIAADQSDVMSEYRP